MTFRHDFVTLGRMTNKQRKSFSNGNTGPEEDQFSGNPIRPVHWWHFA